MKARTSGSFISENQHGYDQLERLIAQRGATIQGPLFTTDVDPDKLWQAYLDGIPAEHRQHYTCHCCRRFTQRFGGLVTVDEQGKQQPALWHDCTDFPAFFRQSVFDMAADCRGAKVNGVFVSSKNVWGEPQTGQWSHLHCRPSGEVVWKHPLLSDSQKMAELKEDHGVLCRSLAEYGTEAALQAVRVLEADVVDRSEKALGVARWFLKLHQEADAVKKQDQRHNLVWLATATAPPGWCHVKSTMIGTLLDDVVAGLPFEEMRRRWNAKMHPLQYQRPTTLSEGNVRQANAVIAKMQAEGSLARRFATMVDVIHCCGVTIAKDGKPLGWTDGNCHISMWLPMAEADEVKEAVKQGDPFDHLREFKATGIVMKGGLKGGRAKITPVDLPPRAIGWDKFNETVMPTARRIEMLVPSGRTSFYALVTTVNAEAPPLLQWDGLRDSSNQADHDEPPRIEEYALPRNPVSWYFYHGGRYAHQFNLTAGAWVNVDAVFLKPPHWQRPEQFAHHAPEVFFALDGCRDVEHVSGGGMFPENLRNEYHGIRKAIEAYYRSHSLAGKDEGNANGLALSGGPFQVKVTAIDGSIQQYNLSK